MELEYDPEAYDDGIGFRFFQIYPDDPPMHRIELYDALRSIRGHRAISSCSPREQNALILLGLIDA